jgi:delta 1-pyrroline-5-carboxylate dehydrogenase
MVNPYLIIGAMIAVGGAYGYGHHVGWGDRDAEMQVEIAKKNDEAREKERELSQQLNDQSTKLSEANNVINQKQSSLDRAIRDGRLRLQTTSCVQAPTNAPTPTGDSSKERSEPNRTVYETTDSDRATLAAIAEIIAQGDRNTAQLNACIDSYNKVMGVMNGQR